MSTALMRSFEARGDCEVVDEPLYAAYLAATGKDHPGRDEILASQPTDPAEVLRRLQRAPVALRYEKHMSHHWLPGFPLEALGDARHLLLIRDPARVVASYAKVREDPVPEDLGLLQQVALRDALRGQVVVVDSDELVADPARVLAAMCAALGIAFTERMLAWPPGRRPTDGVWARHWYAAVEASNGFAPPRRDEPHVPERLVALVDALRPAYEALAALRLDPGATPS